MAYRPQSSGKVEHMNRSLKLGLSKLCQKISLKWVQALLLILFKVRCTPSKSTGYSPYKVLYHRPPPILHNLTGTSQELRETELLHRQLEALGNGTCTIFKWVLDRVPVSLFAPVHPFSSGIQVWLKDRNPAPLYHK